MITLVVIDINTKNLAVLDTRVLVGVKKNYNETKNFKIPEQLLFFSQRVLKTVDKNICYSHNFRKCNKNQYQLYQNHG